MRRQKSPYTLLSWENSTEALTLSSGSSSYESLQSYSSPLCPSVVVTDPVQSFVPVSYVYPADYNPVVCSSSLVLESEEAQRPEFNDYYNYDSWNYVETIPFFMPMYNECDPKLNYVPYYPGESFQQESLAFEVPTVTDYGAVTILLKHLIRVDVTSEGALCVYNFPSMSTTTLNVPGNKCSIVHPNARVYQDGSVTHILAGENRLTKVCRRGIIFSSSQNSLAYLVDESGTKSTTEKFMDLRKDFISSTFYDGSQRTFQELEHDSFRMASESIRNTFPDGSDIWVIGNVKIKQDRFGEVTISRNNGRRVIMTSPTIRSMTVELPTVSVNIDCFSKHYLTVRRDNRLVTSGFCGMTVQNGSQKAGLDRNGRLVLF